MIWEFASLSVKEKFPSAVLEYKVAISNRNVYLDIAVPEFKLNFEYDGLYWHNSYNRKDKKYNDEERDKELKKLGWQIFRFQYLANPTKQKLEEDYNGRQDIRFNASENNNI